jgi:hypothetical protein
MRNPLRILHQEGGPAYPSAPISAHRLGGHLQVEALLLAVAVVSLQPIQCAG